MNATDAREILARYQLAVDVHRESLSVDPERRVSGWVYDATRQALDAAHAVCRQFGCPRGEQVDEWLRAQLLAMGGLLRAAGEAADVIMRFKPKGDGTEIRLRSAIGAAQIAGATPAEPFLLRFPTMLRKMWSGGEVQAWLDALPTLYAAPHAAPLARETSNPHRGGSQAYLATEHFNEGWNACIDEFDAYIECVVAEGSAAAEPATAPEVGADIDALRARVCQAVTEALGEAYDCMRVWSAWGVGTMGRDDFRLVTDDPERVGEIADAAIDALRAGGAA
ncbi:hypothetical protein DF121_34130 [Burkholderia stagnalis]|nr:hypothetical protein DF145_33665 [Burkholderia stagnalis]RQX87125.1 hypothetical protein DF121_34130 [Burkholderia stagnalis]RQY07213.1 hypothetical protein DF115_34160 [Burkholderia stagnalis]RQY22295.1 hypothetical protein DF114_34080 [Burkholderia stagnalis]